MPAEQSNERVKRWPLTLVCRGAKVPDDGSRWWQELPAKRSSAAALRGRGYEVVEVIPAGSPQVLSVEEARLWIKAHDFVLTDEEIQLAKAVAQRLSDFAEEADRG
jgi:hypothetical protein